MRLPDHRGNRALHFVVFYIVFSIVTFSIATLSKTFTLVRSLHTPQADEQTCEPSRKRFVLERALFFSVRPATSTVDVTEEQQVKGDVTGDVDFVITLTEKYLCPKSTNVE